MSTLKKDHILEAGGGALAGGAAGAALGAAVAGPAGLAVGAVAGGALGAVLGDKAADKADGEDSLGHFEQIHAQMPYYVDGMSWDDYAPAYRYGLQTYAMRAGRDFGQAEAELQAGWARARGASRLEWLQARGAVEHAWRSLDDTLHGGESRDGRHG